MRLFEKKKTRKVERRPKSSALRWDVFFAVFFFFFQCVFRCHNLADWIVCVYFNMGKKGEHPIRIRFRYFFHQVSFLLE